MNHTTRRISLAALCLSALFAFAGCKDDKAADANGGTAAPPKTANTNAAPSGDSIVVGEYASFTGSEATFGHDTDDGLQIAIDEANAAGGVSFGGAKKQLTLEKQDDQSTSQGVSTALNLVFTKNPAVVIGEVASSRSKVGGTLCQDKKIPMISPSSTNAAVTQIGDYVFRVCFIDPYQAAIVARFAIDGIKAKNVAIYTNKDQDYSKGFSADFKTAFEKYGGKVILQQYYGNTDTDYKSGLSKIAQSHPDAILVPGYYKDAGSICKQAREIGINIPILGGDGWSSKELFTFGGDGLKNTYFSDHVDPNDPSPAVQTFVTAYKKKFAGKTPSSIALLGYDAGKLAFDAMTRAKSNSTADLRDSIADTKNFAGASGTITIDKDRNAAKTAVIMTPAGDHFTLFKKIDNPDKPM